MNKTRGRGFSGLALSAVVCASYWLLADNYRAYRLVRRTGNKLFHRNEEVQEEPALAADAVVIEGFRHSGNSFLVGNVAPSDIHRVHSHSHRAFALREAVESSVPTVVMIRDPLEAALSLRHRSHSADVMAWGVRFTAFTALVCWLGYYRSVWKLRRGITFVQMEDMAVDCRAVFAKVSAATGLSFKEETSYATRHRFDGARPEQNLSWASRLVLAQARRLHASICAYPEAAHAETRMTPALATV
ncbi:hypothetical protein [Caulobacter sp. NIBR2454]|uniref:hypothetical protein n=1 Tax=Caulobacter sp. NIBR2454 TaxID=3015996 RepID=UPI0022B63292|nr:hypothetical protein [Caulobacter sp. NIBR2454]